MTKPHSGAKVALEPAPDVAGGVSLYDQLLARSWISPGVIGTHHYSGLFLELFLALDLQFRREGLRLDAEEHKFPALIPLPVLATSGYLANFPHQANFVCHLPEQAGAIDDFRARLTTPPSPEAAAAAVEACCAPASRELDAQGTGLAPTVCFQFFHRHAGRCLAAGQFLTATAVSPCFRLEGRATRGLHRLREFTLREIMVLGPAGVVQSWRAQLINSQRRMLERCQLRAIVRTSFDPFFLDASEKKRLLQPSPDLKSEVRAWLPNSDEGIAIGSVNHHQDYFGNAFNIRFPSGEPVHSACLGFGIDRWCLAVFAQHGLEPNRWPQSLQALLEEYRAFVRGLRDGSGRTPR